MPVEYSINNLSHVFPDPAIRKNGSVVICMVWVSVARVPLPGNEYITGGVLLSSFLCWNDRLPYSLKHSVDASMISLRSAR